MNRTPMIEIDRERAQVVVQRVTEAFRTGQGILADQSDLVEHQIPPGVAPLSYEHAQFLFFTVPNDHGMKSSQLYSRAKKLFCEHPEMFQPSSILRMFDSEHSTELVDRVTRPLGSRYPVRAAQAWFFNARRLQEMFGGDARRLFECSNDAGKLLKEILSFRGYGPKTGGMLLRAIAGLGFGHVEGLAQVLVPVDIHDARIAFLTEIVHTCNTPQLDTINYYDYVRPVQEIILKACNDLGMLWLDADRALWLIGSRGCVVKKCRECPLPDICSVGRVVVAQMAMIV